MENCFIILGLSFDPVENDEHKINEAINKKVQTWQNESKNPKKTVMAKEKLGMVPEIKRIMADSALRAIEAEKAKASMDDKLKEASLEIRLRLSAGEIKEDEIKEIIKKYSDFGISEEQLKSLFPSSSMHGAPKLPPNIVSQLETYFSNLGMDDMSIYKFLQTESQNHMQTVHDMAEKRLQFLLQKGEKTSSDEMEQKIAGIAKQIFASNELYEEYNYYLRGHRFRKINQLLNSSVKNGENRVNDEMFKVLFELCGETYNMSPNQYSDYIQAACRYDGYIIENGVLEKTSNLLPPPVPATPAQKPLPVQEVNTRPDIIEKMEARFNTIGGHIKQLHENMEENAQKFGLNIPSPTSLSIYLGVAGVFLLVNIFFLIQFSGSITSMLANILYFITLMLLVDGAYNGYLLYKTSSYLKSARSFFTAETMFREMVRDKFMTLPFSMDEINKRTPKAADYLNGIIDEGETLYSLCFNQYNKNIKSLKKFTTPPRYGYLTAPRIILVGTLFFVFYYVVLKYFPQML